MPRKQPNPTTAEARTIRQAIATCGMSQIAIADHMEVSPGMVSQWVSGYRPVPAQKAVKLGWLIGADPSDISADFREV